MSYNLKDISAGLFFIFAGLLYGSMAWLKLPMGEALNMGPGYFPTVLAFALILLGSVICFRAWIDTHEREPFGVVPWRGVIMLSLATIIFGTFVEHIGLFPCVFASTFVARFANRTVKIPNALLGSLCIAMFCTAVFGYGVKLPLPIVGEWLRW